MLRIFFVIALIFSQFALAGTSAQTIVEFNEKFKEIIVDMRGSRGGNGDVAAGYLTIMDMIQNYQVKGSITVLVDHESNKILQSLAKANSVFWSSVSIHTIKTLDSHKIFDLYLALASPSGSLKYRNDIVETNNSDVVPGKINIKSEGVSIVQTVLGNTENFQSINFNALVRSHGLNYDMSPAGIASDEAGIYNDFVASSLRNQTSAQVSRFVLSESLAIEDDFSRNAVQQIVSQLKLRGAKVGLAYGISAIDTKVQFMSYLNGLANSTEDSFCLITPSRFNETDIRDPILTSKIQFVYDIDSLPQIAERGKIYVIKTKTLPHKVFVGLMAYSMKKGITPVGAGDGFMSAAINLGGPFVLTRVAWNAKNIQNLKNKLSDLARKFYNQSMLKKVDAILSKLFVQIDFNHVQSINMLLPLFAKLSESVPDLSERIINAAVMVTTQPPKDSAQMAQHIEEISDSILRKSISKGGQPDISKASVASFPDLAFGIWPTNSYKNAKISTVGFNSSKKSSDTEKWQEHGFKMVKKNNPAHLNEQQLVNMWLDKVHQEKLYLLEKMNSLPDNKILSASEKAKDGYLNVNVKQCENLFLN